MGHAVASLRARDGVSHPAHVIGHRLAVAAAVATFLLLAVGGIVTSRDAGMVFPDWPLSNGSVNPDGWLKDADMLSEHGHRILGTLVGMLTLALAVWLQIRYERRWVRILGWCALVGVIAQGILGGIRVLHISGELAMIHGVTGQLYFCLMILLAYATSRDAREEPEEGHDTASLAVCAVAALFATFMQVVLGAQLRHNLGPINTHFLGALLVAGTIFWMLAVALLAKGRRRPLIRPALIVTALLLVQVGLGIWTAHELALSYEGRDPPLLALLLPSLHQATGALMLAAVAWMTFKSIRRTGRFAGREAVT